VRSRDLLFRPGIETECHTVSNEDDTRYVEETNLQSDDEFEIPGVVSRFYLKQNLAAGSEEDITYGKQQQQHQFSKNEEQTSNWVILTEKADDGSGRAISERRFPLLFDKGSSG
jgi:hypothetical protein